MENDRNAQLPDEIISYYGLGGEAQRLQHGEGLLEYIRSQDIIQRHIPQPPAVVLDVGGGTGVYAFWLAGLGYEVHLVDATPLHIERAREIQRQADHPLASIEVGDARQLNSPDNSVDTVLLLGPLYHLTAHADRIAALREAYRVLKPSGVLLAAAISRYASFLGGIKQDRLEDPEFVRILESDLQNGQHRNESKSPRNFTTAYFHHPDELGEELNEARFIGTTLLAVEGPVWLLANLDKYSADNKLRQQLLQFVKTVETEPSIMGVSAHLIAIGQKP